MLNAYGGISSNFRFYLDDEFCCEITVIYFKV